MLQAGALSVRGVGQVSGRAGGVRRYAPIGQLGHLAARSQEEAPGPCWSCRHSPQPRRGRRPRLHGAGLLRMAARLLCVLR